MHIFYPDLLIVKYSRRISQELKWEKNPHFLRAIGGMGKCPSREQHPLKCCRNTLLSPQCQRHTRAAQNPVKAFLVSQQEGLCSRDQCPRKKARGDRKRGLDPNLNEGSKAEVGVSFSGAQVADDRDVCRRLDEGSSRFQLNLPRPWWPLCRHQRCSCCPSDGAGPGSSPQDGGASTPVWKMLVAACPLRWLLLTLP